MKTQDRLNKPPLLCKRNKIKAIEEIACSASTKYFEISEIERFSSKGSFYKSNSVEILTVIKI